MAENPEEICDSLGRRQQALNARVDDAVASNIDFENIRNASETSDIDRFFKIDIASKLKHTDFVIETLKCGDEVYITRVINKCEWLFDKEHADIVNPKYLYENVFKFMSLKMKKKFLTAISSYVAKERAEDFFQYCVKNKLNNNALKFLVFANEEFKEMILLDDNHHCQKALLRKDISYIKHFIGSSFTLLETYLSLLPDEKKFDFIFHSQHLYSVNNEKYLEVMQRYAIEDEDDNLHLYKHWQQFNVRFSRKLMTKHKDSVLNNPRFFVKRIERDTFLKHLTIDDAKTLAFALLPSSSSDFWDHFYLSRHKFFLKLIPHEQMYQFFKKIYENKYPGEVFEMSPRFYNQDFHLFMTTDEQENWALQHLKLETPIDCSIGCDYNWYEFINFEYSFEEMRKRLIITTDPYERNGMISALLRSAKTDHDIEKVLNFYNEKMAENDRHLKDSFLHNVIIDKNIFKFDESCWTAFYKLLHVVMELFNTEDLSMHNNIYKTVTLLYYILHQKEMQVELKAFMADNFSHVMINNGDYGHYNKLTDEQRNQVYNYLYQYYVDRVSECRDELFTSEVSTRLKRYFNNITGLMRQFRPEVVIKELVKKDGRHCKKNREVNHSLSDKELLRRLKKDSNLVTCDDVLSKIRVRFEKYPFKISSFLKKLRIYFFNDVAKTYLNIFQDIASKYINLKSMETGVYAIFQLSDEKTRTIPNPNYELQPQFEEHELCELFEKAICRFFCYSRPATLSNIEEYITKKNYKHILVTYLVHLPRPLCLQLLEIMRTRIPHSIYFSSRFELGEVL